MHYFENFKIKDLNFWRKRGLLPTGRDKRDVLGVGSIPVAILPSRQDVKYIAL